MSMIELGQRAKAASRQLARATTAQKNAALLTLADQLLAHCDDILAANAIDVEAAKANGLSAAMIDRLLLNEKRLQGIAADQRNVANLPDPVGEIFEATTLPNGLKIHKQRVPL